MLNDLKSDLDLTPLLDVILILLFVFMMQLALKEDTIKLENQKLAEENANLKDSLNQVSDVIYENETELKELIAKNNYNRLNQLEIDLAESFKEETILKDLIKYNAVIDNFIQLDLSLATSDNFFSINDSQKLRLNPDSQTEFDILSREVQARLTEKLNLKANQNEKYLLILAIKDQYVSLNAYRIIEKAIKQLENQYPETIFIFADYYILEN